MRSLFIPFIALTLAINLPLGCSKESKTTTTTPSAPPQSNQLLQDPLLGRLPTTTVGFLISDLQGEGYKRFKASPWFNEVPFQSAFDELKRAGADQEQIKIVESLSQFLTKLGAISPDGKSRIEQVIGSLVLLADQPTPNPDTINVAAYLSAAASTNLKEKLPILRDGMKELGASVKDGSVAGAEGFVAILPKAAETQEETKEISLYIAASEKLLGISNEKSLVENLFSTTASNGIANIKELPEFKRVEASVRGAESPLFVGFASVAKVNPPSQALPDGSLDGSDLPVDGIMISQGIDGKIFTRGSVAVTARTEMQRTVFTALADGSLPNSTKSFPADVALALALDTKAIAKLGPLLEAFEQTNPGLEVPQLKAVKGVTLGIRTNDGGSPIPEILLALESESRDDLANVLESSLGNSLKMMGQEAMWMSKDIAGAPTRYFTSLLGVGLFISKPANSNTVLVTSSERATKDLLGTGSDAMKLQPDSMGDKKSGALYLNFAEVANVMDSLKSSLAMFTGGSSEFDKAFDSAKVRTIGVSSSTLGYHDGVFAIESTLSPPAVR